MRFGRCGTAALACLFLLPPAASWAGQKITFEAVYYSSETETTTEEIDRRENVLLVDEGRLRTIGGDAEGFDLIADVQGSVIYVLDATRQAFARIPFSLERDTAAAPDTGAADFVIETVEEGGEVKGYPTRLYRIYEDSALIREIRSTESFNLGFDFMRMMEGLETEFEKISPQEDFGEMVRLFRKIRGVPLADVQYYPAGKDVLQAKTVLQRKFRAEDFLPPKNYAEKTLKEIAELPPTGDEGR